MPDTENCGRIPRKIPKTWSVEVVVGVCRVLFVSAEDPLYRLGLKKVFSEVLQCGNQHGYRHVFKGGLI